MRSKTKKLNGFTLAEALVTLTLIGIVASMVLPTIQKITPSTNKALYRKSFYTLQRAIDAMLNTEEVYPTSQTTLVSGVTIPRGFNYTEDPTGAADIKSENKFCYYLKQNLNAIVSADCFNKAAAAGTSPTLFAKTPDGVQWFMGTDSTYAATSQFATANPLYVARVIVDVDSSPKSSNCSADSLTTALPSAYQAKSGNATKCPNPDTFIFSIMYNGKIRVANSSPLSTSNSVTDTVAESIMKNPTDNKQN